MSVPVSSINRVAILLYIDPRLMARIIISCFWCALITGMQKAEDIQSMQINISHTYC